MKRLGTVLIGITMALASCTPARAEPRERPPAANATAPHFHAGGRAPDHDGDRDRDRDRHRRHQERPLVVYQTIPYFYEYPAFDGYYTLPPVTEGSALAADDIIRLVAQQFTDDAIIGEVRSRGISFTLSVETIRYLQDHMVSERVLNYLLAQAHPAQAYGY